MSTPPVVRHELRGRAYWITIDRANKRNALNAAALDGLRTGWRAAHAHPEARVIVLTGSGEQAFCAGGDLQPGQGFAFDPAQPTLDYAELLREVQRSRLPSISRVNGACLAGGMGLLCMTDLAVAAEHARFGLPEVRVGVFPMQVLSLLQRMVAKRRVREWALTGAAFDAAEALAAGLLNAVVAPADLDAAVERLVARLAEASPTAQRRGLYALQAIEAMGFEQALAFSEGQIALLAATEDAREGLAAFNEKREPTWTGR